VLTDGQYASSNGGRAQEVAATAANFPGWAANGEAPPDLLTPLSLGEGLPADPALRGADLLLDALAIDTAAAQAGVRRFLGLLNEVGTALAASPGGVSFYCWLLAAGAAGSACWTVHRQSRQKARLLPALVDAGNPGFPWDPEGRP
jgi:hypothetical protein